MMYDPTIGVISLHRGADVHWNRWKDAKILAPIEVNIYHKGADSAPTELVVRRIAISETRDQNASVRDILSIGFGCCSEV